MLKLLHHLPFLLLFTVLGIAELTTMPGSLSYPGAYRKIERSLASGKSSLGRHFPASPCHSHLPPKVQGLGVIPPSAAVFQHPSCLALSLQAQGWRQLLHLCYIGIWTDDSSNSHPTHWLP